MVGAAQLLPGVHHQGAVMNDTIPVGTIVPFVGANVPDKWLECLGGTFDANTYPELAKVLGTTTLPELVDRFPAGAGSTLPPGTSAGSFDYSKGEMQSHTHRIDPVSASHVHGWSTSNGDHQHDLLMYYYPAPLGAAAESSYIVGDGQSSKELSGNHHTHMTVPTSNAHSHRGADAGTTNIEIRPAFIRERFIIRAKS